MSFHSIGLTITQPSIYASSLCFLNKMRVNFIYIYIFEHYGNQEVANQIR